MPAAPAKSQEAQEAQGNGKAGDAQPQSTPEESPQPPVSPQSGQRSRGPATYMILFRDSESGPWDAIGEQTAPTQQEARTKAVTQAMIDSVKGGGHVELVAVARWEPKVLKIEQPPPKLVV